ncbi:hypothetical protein [Actinomadura sp. NEAU-AAG7]|uniref:hypothetical protein n=1 Tax=Actinomadura sp. NEAU-AAG7 TaxID=2839640 RepID=UPI001BE4ADB1|nr:hypothetical protein [Actinomadura sp. NEAU-AAG7]MBT2207728.1 hypothetical protein [Actinomadura sp. NEAU-AAG7]
MTALADQHLTDLKHHLQNPSTDQDIHRPDTPAEIARLTHVLIRYTDQIATGFGLPQSRTNDVEDAARQASALLKQAEHLLGPPAETETPQSALAEKLRATSIALGCGLDLLSSHFPTAPDQATTPTAIIIATPETARSLLHRLSTPTATAAHLTQQILPPTNQAATPLLKAASLTQTHGQDQTSPTTAIPFHHTPQRIPPTLDEDPTQTLAGLTNSIQRLSTPHPSTSVTTWRYLARAAAIICDLNSKTLYQLMHRMTEPEKPEHSSAFKQAAAKVNLTGSAWRNIVRRWDQQLGHYGHPANGPATDADDLIIRLGRLIHADPAWTPGPRASLQLKPPHHLAPDLPRAAHLATITLKAIEACNNIAAPPPRRHQRCSSNQHPQSPETAPYPPPPRPHSSPRTANPIRDHKTQRPPRHRNPR